MLIIIIIATFRFLSHAHKLLSIHSIHSLSYHTLTCQDTAWHLNIHFLFTRQHSRWQLNVFSLYCTQVWPYFWSDDMIRDAILTWPCLWSECLQCFDTVGWVSGRASGLKKLGDEVLVWLSVWSEVQIVCIWSSWCHYIPKPRHLLHHLNPDWFYLSGTSLPRLSWKEGR